MRCFYFEIQKVCRCLEIVFFQEQPVNYTLREHNKEVIDKSKEEIANEVYTGVTNKVGPDEYVFALICFSKSKLKRK